MLEIFSLFRHEFEVEMHNSPRVTHVLSFKEQLSRAAGELKMTSSWFCVTCWSVLILLPVTSRRIHDSGKICGKFHVCSGRGITNCHMHAWWKKQCSTLGFNLDSGTWDRVSSELEQSEISLKMWKDVFVIPTWHEAGMHKSPIATHFLTFKKQISRAAGEIKCCALGFVWLLISTYSCACHFEEHTGQRQNLLQILCRQCEMANCHRHAWWKSSCSILEF